MSTLAKASSFIVDMIKSIGKNRFTYREVQDYYFTSPWREKISYHTVERYLRKLAQHNIIARRQDGKTVEFIVPVKKIEELGRLKREYIDARNRGDYERARRAVEKVVEMFGVDIATAVDILNFPPFEK